jgi:hypothetical protein
MSQQKNKIMDTHYFAHIPYFSRLAPDGRIVGISPKIAGAIRNI